MTGEKLSFKRKMDPVHADYNRDTHESIEITAKLTWSSCEKSDCSTDIAKGFEETLEEKTINIFTGIGLDFQILSVLYHPLETISYTL